MKFLVVIQIVLSVCYVSFVNAITSDETLEVTELCCSRGETFAVTATTCSGVGPPDEIEPEEVATCVTALKSCCEKQMKEKEACFAGTKLASAKQCNMIDSDIGRSCCDDCTFGQWTGESQGKGACQPPGEEFSPSASLRRIAAYQCCLKAAEQSETTTEKKITTTTEKKIETTTEKKIPSTTEKKIETTTEKKIPSTMEKKIETTTEKKVELKRKCEKSSCEHVCNDKDGLVKCACNKGYRLQDDQRSCKDINECAESLDDLCLEEDTVCHNTEGAYKCVSVKKRDLGLSCPPGFKRNVQNQVCDDINECQLPRPPCPKYICENTIGGYKCAGKAGKPFEEAAPGAITEPSATTTAAAPKNDICPPGFRAGADDECVDIDECNERLDDCQRLSQHCINTHGNFFCQDHVSKRCAPGFKVNAATGICEDIDECELGSEVCRRSEVCINLPGAYNCKSKISTLPKLATKKCQEGTRLRVGGSICEDIDECREGTHLCDQFQNCINTFGGHECRCKNGFELDSSSGSCVDIDECALKLDNCSPGLHCLNVLGSFTCTRRVITTSTTTSTTAAPPIYEYEYYDSEEELTTPDSDKRNLEPVPTTSTSTTTRRPTPPPTTSTTSTTPRPRPRYPDISRYITTSTTTIAPRRPEYTPRRPEDYTIIPESLNENPRWPEEPAREPETPGIEDNLRRPEEYPRRPVDYPRRPDEPLTEPTPTRPTTPDTTPRRPEYNPRRPEYNPRPTTNRRPETTPRRTEVPTVVTTPTPTPRDPNTDNDINRGSPYDDYNLHCLDGFEKNEYGQCVDVDECKNGRHICSNMEVCVNRNGGYSCDCMTGFQRDPTGWCAVATTSSTSTSTTSTTTTSTTTTSTTTEKPHAVSSPEWPYTPPRPRGSRVYPPNSCELGYTYDEDLGKCVDIDECTINTMTCSPLEECVNLEGGFRCECGRACYDGRGRHTPAPTATTPTPQPTHPPSPTTGTNVGNDNGGGGYVITVGAQYGQRGSWSPRPTYTRLPDTGAIVTSCPWGYKLTPDKRCYDIDECERNVSECGPQQKCENFYGGYSCQCPAGHQLVGQNSCDDIDECMHGSPCSYNAECVNTVGSYRCMCGEGFRNAPTNDKVCADVDECTETPGVCHQSCANAWGGYRCYCKRGYRLENDNRTCTDVNECEEWSAVRLRGKICGGTCVNMPGSYRCDCPSGYKLSDDTRSCIDIDECETGEATCARAADQGEVCQNTRGSYHCHQIQCPPGYKLEAKHRCSRIRRSCPVGDWSCLQQPSTYSYNFITFVANIYLPTGSVDLFTMHGPSWRESIVSFEMRMINVQSSFGVRPADFRCFDMRPSGNICVISLTCSLAGPQVTELELTMSLYQRGQFAGSAVARLIVIVSEYDF